jgi:hypothetical protein
MSEANVAIQSKTAEAVKKLNSFNIFARNDDNLLLSKS